jgi:hypothetical protein
MHIWLVGLKFCILFLLNDVYMMHFERILTILLHFLERVLESQYFYLYSLCTHGSKKEPIPNVYILFPEMIAPGFLRKTPALVTRLRLSIFS